MEKVDMKYNVAEKGALVSTAESNIYVIGSTFTDNYGKVVSAGFQMKKDVAVFKNCKFTMKNMLIVPKV